MSATQTTGKVDGSPGAAVDPAVDPAEVARFEAMAAEWWDPQGKFKPLHMLNPLRLSYIVEQITAEFGRDPKSLRSLDGLSLIDIGCGGGLLTEPMARLGAQVVGIDASGGTIPVARLHAQQSGLAIDYRQGTAEALVAEGGRFDVVLAMEVIEHVPSPAAFVVACRDLLKPGGQLICSTLNRTVRSFGAAILGAEWVMRWLPRGTHDWRKFITPDEIAMLIQAAGLELVDRKGFVFDPLGWEFRLSDRDLSVNYVAVAVRPISG